MEKHSYFKETKELINPNMHMFLYVLMKYIIFGKENIKDKTRDKLEKFVEVINKNYNTNFEISFDSSKFNCKIENLKKVITLIKKQSFAFVSEIIENVLIRLLSFTFFTKKSKFFGKFIYNDLKLLREKNSKFNKWMDKSLLKYLFNFINFYLKDILEYDFAMYYKKENVKDNPVGKSLFIKFLFLLDLNRFIINRQKKADKNNINKDSIITISSNASCLYYSKDLNHIKKDSFLPQATSTFISSYIYYQNKNSSFMKYLEDAEDSENNEAHNDIVSSDISHKNSDNLIKLPFIYELSEAGIDDSYLGIILKPIRIEPRVSVIRMNKNNFGKEGILELHKTIIFNKNIKEISLKNCKIKSKDLETFEKNLKLIKNQSIENLDISFNHIKSDVDLYLAKMISILKSLKTFTISSNVLKSGAAALFVTLKKLYRKNKIKLETLILNKCELDETSFYELGELLKSKYCKLKCLCLSMNYIPSNVKFFEALKKNRSLREIYLYDCGIKNNNVDTIERIISNANLEILYLHVNKINDFNQFLRIIYRNSLIKNKEEKQKENIICDFPCLYNLNMNKTDCFNKNIEKIKLLKIGIERTNLSALDLTSVLYGYKIQNEYSRKYYDEINSLNDDLKIKLDTYKNAEKEILNNKIDKERLEKMISEENKKEFEKLTQLEEIINNTNSNYEGYIRKRIKEIKHNLSFKDDKNRMKLLLDYINLKRAEKILNENEKIERNAKMILI